MIPMVVEQSGRNERAYDIFSRLLKDNIVFITGHIDDQTGNTVIAQLLHLSQEDPERPISLFINSPGGSISAGLAILDTMNFIEADVYTFCIGQAASMAAVLLAGGKKGKRFGLPNSRIMIHQPSMYGVHGQATDIEIYAKEIIDLRSTLNDILAAQTGQPLDRIAKDVERDYIMRPEAAVAYGIIDKIVTKKEIA